MTFLAPSRNAVLAAAAVIIIFAVINLLDLGNQTFSGFTTDPQNTVIQVRSGSPAEEAGFAVGDRVVSSDGIAISDTKALAQRPRAEVGQSRVFVVERAGEEVTLNLTLAGLPSRQMMLGLLGILTGLCFLVFGIWPFLQQRDQTTTLLAVLSVCFGLLFVGMPYLASLTLRTILGVVFLPIVLLGFATLLHFMLSFPRRNAWLEGSHALKILYGPAALISIYLVLLTILRPDATSVLNTITSVTLGLFFVVYFGLAVIIMVRTFMRASAEERASHGLNIMVAGVVVALLPIVIAIAVNTVAPKIVLPGNDFAGAFFILLPLSFGYAVMKVQKAQPQAA